MTVEGQSSGPPFLLLLDARELEVFPNPRGHAFAAQLRAELADSPGSGFQVHQGEAGADTLRKHADDSTATVWMNDFFIGRSSHRRPRNTSQPADAPIIACIAS